MTQEGLRNRAFSFLYEKQPLRQNPARLVAGNLQALHITMKATNTPPTHVVLFVLVMVYISWGTVYLGNKLSLEVAGPFVVCGVRNILAGMLMLACARLSRGSWRRISPRDWGMHSLLAVLLVVASGGLLVLGQTMVTSVATAVIMSSTPIFMLIGAFLFAGEKPPNLPQCIGMITGACGVIFLSWHEQSSGSASIWGVISLLGAVLGWVSGSLIMKKVPVTRELSMLQSTGLILFLGGVESFLLGLLLGEASTFHPENINAANAAAFAWMVVGGSFIAYWSYLWLLAHVAVSLAVSYEYVVPVIGIFLGWALAGETVTTSTIAACCVTIGSVFLVVRHRHSFRAYVRHYFVRRASSAAKGRGQA